MIDYKGIRISCNHKIIPFKNYNAINFFGRLLTRMSEVDMINYLGTERGKILVNHERIHLLQKETLHSWLLFYILYFWYWAKLYFVTFNHKMSYRTIPFEIEAYGYETDMEYNKSYWKSFKLKNKERKIFFNIK